MRWRSFGSTHEKGKAALKSGLGRGWLTGEGINKHCLEKQRSLRRHKGVVLRLVQPYLMASAGNLWLDHMRPAGSAEVR